MSGSFFVLGEVDLLLFLVPLEEKLNLLGVDFFALILTSSESKNSRSA